MQQALQLPRGAVVQLFELTHHPWILQLEEYRSSKSFRDILLVQFQTYDACRQGFRYRPPLLLVHLVLSDFAGSVY